MGSPPTDIETLSKQNKVELFWVPGHTGVPDNERADSMEKQKTKKNPIRLEAVL
jgi:ribonuclease HI